MLSWSGPILYPILRRVGRLLGVMVPFDFGLQLFLFALWEAVVMHVWMILNLPVKHLFFSYCESANWTESRQRCLYSFPFSSASVQVSSSYVLELNLDDLSYIFDSTHTV